MGRNRANDGEGRGAEAVDDLFGRLHFLCGLKKNSVFINSKLIILAEIKQINSKIGTEREKERG